MEAKPVRETGMHLLMHDILGAVEQEPRTLPHCSPGCGNQEFGTSRTLPDKLVGVRHLASPGARTLLTRCPAGPASIARKC